MKPMPMPDLRHLAAALAALVVSSDAFASQELVRSKNCVACHHPERRMVGPSFAAIAGRYANDDTAVRVLSQRVLEGGSGQWGQMPMPAQSDLTQAEAEALVQYILSLK
jgi:cytochrome c